MMNATFVTTLSTQELQELIELSVKKAVQVSPKMSNEDDTLLDTKEKQPTSSNTRSLRYMD